MAATLVCLEKSRRETVIGQLQVNNCSYLSCIIGKILKEKEIDGTSSVSS
jgi:hypothetical protein